MKTVIENKQYDKERALYALKDTEVRGCTFAGEADGESAMKEARGISVSECRFSLRYPMWHVADFTLKNSVMDENTRAALWYSSDGEISGCTLGGIKAVRECRNVKISGCSVNSSEFGWKCCDISIVDSDITSEYPFLDSRNIMLKNVSLSGKYSFQYVEGLELSDSTLATKDAFWHAKNAVVRNCVINGEYLGWYSDGLTLIDCAIKGTQPLCYCKNLKLINCTMENCDLAFEYSDVTADVRGHIDSVKNPHSGVIKADSIGEIIANDSVMECFCELYAGGQKF